jgi:hypothetical protein
MKLDSTGNILSQIRIDSGLSDRFTGMVSDTNGIVYLLFHIYTGNTYTMSAVHSFDASLQHLWSRAYPNNLQVYKDINITSDGYLFLSGYQEDLVSNEIPALTKLNSAGDILWTKGYSGNIPNYFPAPSALSTGDGMNILGYDYAPGIGTYHVLRFNTDSAGNLNWGAKSGNIFDMPEPFDACLTANDKLLITGRYFEVQGFIYQSDAASMHSCYDTMITLNTMTLFVTDSAFIPSVTSTSFTTSPQVLTVAGGMSLLNICTTTSLTEIH